jgi:hypothetical protein
MTVKKANRKRRKSIDFSKGVRGKYADMKIVILGATKKPASRKANKQTAEIVLRQVSRVLNSAGSTKQELESAINHARHLIDSAG